MFLKQAFIPENNPFKYLIGFIVIALLFLIGQLPLTGYVLFLVAKQGIVMPSSESEIFKMMDSNLALFLALLSFLAVFLALPSITKKIHHQSFLSLITTRKSIDYKRLFFSFSVWGLVVITSTVVEYFLNPGDFIFQFNIQKFAILLLVAGLLLPIQSATEELLFRGYLMQGFGVFSNNKLVALLASSVLFGLMHGFNPEVAKMGNLIMVYYVGTGLMLGIITLMDDGLELALGFHIANNLLTALLVTADWTALQTNSVLKDISEPNAGYQILFPVFVVYPILLIIFAKKYQWSNWKDKLIGNIIINSNNGDNEHANTSERS